MLQTSNIIPFSSSALSHTFIEPEVHHLSVLPDDLSACCASSGATTLCTFPCFVSCLSDIIRALNNPKGEQVKQSLNLRIHIIIWILSFFIMMEFTGEGRACTPVDLTKTSLKWSDLLNKCV